MAAIRRLVVDVETVTPLFLGGTDPRGEPELRSPAFRGALRYWWRALAGGVVGTDVAGPEAEIFGTTEKGSRVIIRVHGAPATQPFQSHRPPGLQPRQSSGHDYLYWSMRGFRGEPGRKSIRPGERFKVEIRAWPGAPDTSLWHAGAALWLLLHLGGLGSRARRTAGSLIACSEPQELNQPIPLPSFGVEASTGADLAKELGEGLCLLRESMARILEVRQPTTTGQFDVLHPDFCRIWVIAGRRPWKRWLEAVEGIGQVMRDFRNRRPPDYQNVRRWLTGKSKSEAAPPTVERAVFGLPLPFRYNSHPRVSGVIQGAQHKRRASPLHLRVTRLTNGTFVGVAVLFKSQFLPSNERLKITRGKGKAPPPDDYGLIEEFVASFANCWEVSFSRCDEG